MKLFNGDQKYFGNENVVRIFSGLKFVKARGFSSSKVTEVKIKVQPPNYLLGHATFRYPLTLILRDTNSGEGVFNKWHSYSSREWALLRRFSRSAVKG